MLVKEFIQLRRDRVSFAMIVMIPVMQLLLFGYAINTTPRHLPTAVLLQEDSDLARSILKAMENTAYFRFTREVHNVAEFDDLLQSGKVLFGVEIPRGFERAVRRGDQPALLVAADATDPVAAGSALGTLGAVVQTALAHDLHSRRSAVDAVRDPRPCPLQSGGVVAAQHRAGPGRHHPDHDHADLHGAVGDARDRARHHGEPAVDADQAGRGDVRQDHSLCAGRLHPGHPDHRHRRLAVRRADPRQRADCWRCCRRCSSPPICRSATPSRPSCRTSCRRCRCR